MPMHALHPRPRWRAVASEQFRAVGLATRRDASLLAGAVAGVSLTIVLHFLRSETPAGGFAFSPEMMTPAVLLALLVPLSVWRDESPSRRSYLWSMPVDQGHHSLLKVLIGWAWLLGLIAALLAWGLMLAGVTGGEIGMHREVARIPTAGRVELLALAAPPWEWAVPFTGATIAYLLGSTVVLASDRPWAWLLGAVVAFLAASTLLDALGAYGLRDSLHSIVDGRYGLQAAFTGTLTANETIRLPSGRLHVQPLSRPILEAWLGATALWTALAGVGVATAARWRGGVR